MVSSKTNILFSFIIGLGIILFTCSVKAEAEKPFAELIYGKIFPDNGYQAFGREFPILALDNKGSYLMAGNFEKLLLDVRNRPAVVPNSNITSEEAEEFNKAAKETIGIVKFTVEGKQRLIKIVKYAYDAKYDVSIVVTSTNDEVMDLSRVSNSQSGATLTCYGRWKLTYPIKIKKSDFILKPTIIPFVEAEVDGTPSTNVKNLPPHITDLSNQFHTCIVSAADNAIIGLVRNIYQKVEQGSLYKSTLLIYQPVDEVFPYAQELASSATNFSEPPALPK